MIKINVGRDELNDLQALRIEITSQSIGNFIDMVNRALNCWDQAPKELKDLGDMLTHGRITQDHTPSPILKK